MLDGMRALRGAERGDSAPFPRVALVGAGHLADALVRGWLAAGMPAERVAVTNRERDDRLAAMAALGVRAVRDKAAALAGAEAVVLAVKPQDAAEALRACGPVWPDGAVLLSLVAGWETRRLLEQLGRRVECVRAMPNTACAVGESATAAYAAAGAAARALADRLLSVVGRVVWLGREEDMDAVTAVAGSGPAYVYLLVEALVEAATAEGLDAATAHDLAVQTVLGAAHHLRASGVHAAELRRRVTTPGGTTAAAVSVLEDRGFRPALAEAVSSAARRSRQLGGR
ncbi:MAG: pyrroline-5-carboxylate reductase [Firmicutes bacterium]|nr:pyrroline-5-carboxylate reductase [Bacillota bacterium]